LESTLLKVLLFLALACVSACSPDKPVDAPPTQAKAGAWAPADAFNPDVQEAARFAVQTFAVQNKARVLYKEVTQARQQVVAGLNFQLQLQVTLDGAPRSVSVTVWRQLGGDYLLQSWDWVD
jgi:hypothetical protein